MSTGRHKKKATPKGMSLPGLDDSLPELVSDEAETSEDSGYDFINTPPNTGDEGFEATPEDFEATPEDFEAAHKTTKEQEEEEEEEEVTKYKDTDKNDKEAQLQESTIDFILNMEDPNYKDPEPRFLNNFYLGRTDLGLY